MKHPKYHNKVLRRIVAVTTVTLLSGYVVIQFFIIFEHTSIKARNLG